MKIIINKMLPSDQVGDTGFVFPLLGREQLLVSGALGDDQCDREFLDIHFEKGVVITLLNNINKLPDLINQIIEQAAPIKLIRQVSFFKEDLMLQLRHRNLDKLFQYLFQKIPSLPEAQVLTIALQTAQLILSVDALIKQRKLLSTIAMVHKLAGKKPLQIKIKLENQEQLNDLYEFAQRYPDIYFLAYCQYQQLTSKQLSWNKFGQAYPTRSYRDTNVAVQFIGGAPESLKSLRQHYIIRRLNNYLTQLYDSQAILLSTKGVCSGLSVLWLTLKAQGMRSLWFWQTIQKILALPEAGLVIYDKDIEYFVNYVAWLQEPDKMCKKLNGEIHLLSDYEQDDVEAITEVFNLLSSQTFCFTRALLVFYLHRIKTLQIPGKKFIVLVAQDHVTALVYCDRSQTFTFYNSNFSDGEFTSNSVVDIVDKVFYSHQFKTKKPVLELHLAVYMARDAAQFNQYIIAPYQELFDRLDMSYTKKFNALFRMIESEEEDSMYGYLVVDQWMLDFSEKIGLAHNVRLDKVREQWGKQLYIGDKLVNPGLHAHLLNHTS